MITKEIVRSRIWMGKIVRISPREHHCKIFFGESLSLEKILYFSSRTHKFKNYANLIFCFWKKNYIREVQ